MFYSILVSHIPNMFFLHGLIFFNVIKNSTQEKKVIVNDSCDSPFGGSGLFG